MITLWFLLLAAPEVVPAAPPSGPPAAPVSVRVEGARRFVTESALDLSAWAKSCRVIPHYEADVPAGFQLTGIDPTSFVAALGFQDGDVVRSVAGQVLSSPGAALEAYARVSATRTAVVEVVRQGERLTWTFVIEPAAPASEAPASEAPASAP